MAFNRKEQLIAVFEDTLYQIQNNSSLKNGTEKSIKKTKCYAPDEYPSLEKKQSAKSEVTVTRHSTFEAARKLHERYPDKRIAVLNFASATNPGGGVKKGSSAQEEALCRCSTLYPTLNQRAMWDQFYSVNRAERNVLHTDACIYSPDVTVFKGEEPIPKTMSVREWFIVDIISCAAPNLRKEVSNAYNTESGNAVTIKPGELNQLHYKRAKHILSVAAANKADILVLGAFGCGAFANDPRIVADASFRALEEYIQYFDMVEFAIYCRNHELENFNAFFDTYERTVLF
ncbi:MAG: TIGR02452 family protein [Ruminococcus sp.]|nr:TIGR02452 family protein [Ruminococcus sp.]